MVLKGVDSKTIAYVINLMKNSKGCINYIFFGYGFW